MAESGEADRQTVKLEEGYTQSTLLKPVCKYTHVLPHHGINFPILPSSEAIHGMPAACWCKVGISKSVRVISFSCSPFDSNVG